MTLAMIGFVAVTMAFWAFVVPGSLLIPLAAASAVVSLLGITLFIGTWPAFNTAAAVGMNLAVLAALLWFSPELLGQRI